MSAGAFTVTRALRVHGPHGALSCEEVRLPDIPRFPYSLLWGERSICSVANLTRQDGRDFMALAATVALRPVVQVFALQDASRAVALLRRGEVQGAAVLRP